ncbi:DMT family transporter [Caldimonas sp. KR1-144]|uniref:DMT family transporter n=1 Tax=Caldimonas sp. KR1-144 TaxID=3400911 RepID=UPI003C090F68
MSATTSIAAPRAPSALLPVAALLVNAFVWGVSWWPFRHLQGLGLHPLWATALIYVIAAAVIVVRWPQSVGQLLRTPVLWILVFASGSTNATFNWAVSIGDVVRVVLLFYLMPLWAVLLARVLLHERLTRLALARVVLALAGAAIVLKPEGAGWPVPSSLSDWLGIAGGFCFALNNVMLRREAHRPPEARALAMFAGGVVVAGAIAAALGALGNVPLPPAPAWSWTLPALLLAGAFLAANLSLQYGAARLRASATAVVMLSEVVFAAGSAVLLGDQALSAGVLLGGALILAAAALATLESSDAH